MMESNADDRTALIACLLRRVHEQSLDGPELSPFWREGAWRCEFHRGAGQDRLKVFRGDRCVHEEIVQGRARAHLRCHELRQLLMQGSVRQNELRPRNSRHRPMPRHDADVREDIVD